MNILKFIFPMIYNHKDNKSLRDKLKNNKIDSLFNNIEEPEKVSIETLKDEYLDTLKMKDKLEDKAKTNVVGITIAITLIMGASSIITSIDQKFNNIIIQWVVFILFSVAVLYMLCAGIIAIKILVNENVIYKIDINSVTDETIMRNEYDNCIVNNRAKNLIRNNSIYTSYECIRNAFVCLFLVLTLSIIPYTVNKHQIDNVENHGLYYYTFSENAIEYLRNNDVKQYIKGTVEDEIRNNTVQENQAIGIVDKTRHLFIKFKVNGELINILLLEPYQD